MNEAILIWPWWGAMFGVGLGVGCLGAWSQNAVRVFMKTLAVPLIVLLSRLALPHLYPIKGSGLYVVIDFVIIAVAALIADYFLGLKLGRHDKRGYRSD